VYSHSDQPARLIIVIASVGVERLWTVLMSVNLGWFLVALAIHFRAW
jgi:hypothetical protein